MHIEDWAFKDIDEVLNCLRSCLIGVIKPATHIDASLRLPDGPKSEPLYWQKAEIEDCCCHYNLTDVLVPMRIEVRIDAL